MFAIALDPEILNVLEMTLEFVAIIEFVAVV